MSADTLAHEYAHTVHFQLAAGKRFNDFVAEGFAEWVVAKVSHYLKWQDYEIAQHRAQREILQQMQILPDVTTLKDARLWIRLRDQPKSYVRTYTFSFLAMDRIIQRKGIPAVLNYLHDGNDDQFFASVKEYVEDLSKTLANTALPKNDFSVDPPLWKVGYKWMYRRTDFGKISTVVKEITGEESYRGTRVFVSHTTEEDTFYAKDLGFVASRKNGKVIRDVVKPVSFFAWPLQLGKESHDSLVDRNFIENRTTKRDRYRIVTGVDQVHVPAGDFNAVKIDSFNADSGRLIAEYWYSPEIKWFVKSITYNAVGFTEEELLGTELKQR
jgi:hypothetical protein